MRTIVHLSDLHFGAVDDKKIAPLLSCINLLDPDLVVISGDLTQRATISEYNAARAFIRSLDRKTLVVPGNHDIPYFNIWKRFLAPFERFNRYILAVSSDVYVDEEIAIIGVNTVQRFAFTEGRITTTELERIEKVFEKIPRDVMRVVFTHHPLELPTPKGEGHTHTHHLVHGSHKAMLRLAKAKIDMFLSGHLHIFNLTDTSVRYKIADYGGLIVQAGTALSTRLRGEGGSFNFIRLERPHVTVEQYQSEGITPNFTLASVTKFAETPSGWKKLS